MRIPAFLRALFLVPCSLFLVLSLACSGDDNGAPPDAGAHRAATYNERCSLCGMQWTVKVDEYANGLDTVEVVVENTGERGTLELRLDKLAGIIFTSQQVAAWREAYPAARATGTPETQLPAIGVRRLQLQPADGTSAPFTLRSGSTWRGRFNLSPDVPAGTAGFVLFFGDVVHETTPQGLIPTHAWVTWDLNRPLIGLDGEVRVTPVASPGTR